MPELFIYPCPVCKYVHDHWTEPREQLDGSFNICPCCGIEFGYQDCVRSHEELGWEWVSKGMKWHSTVIPPPADWDAQRQYTTIYLSERDFAVFQAALEEDSEPNEKLRAAAKRFKGSLNSVRR